MCILSTNSNFGLVLHSAPRKSIWNFNKADYSTNAKNTPRKNSRQSGFGGLRERGLWGRRGNGREDMPTNKMVLITGILIAVACCATVDSAASLCRLSSMVEWIIILMNVSFTKWSNNLCLNSRNWPGLASPREIAWTCYELLICHACIMHH